MNDADIARAQAFGRAAARDGLPVSVCPYPGDTDENRVLRFRFVMAYARAGGAKVLKLNREAAVGALKRAWYGPAAS